MPSSSPPFTLAPALLEFMERLPGLCVIATDHAGRFTHFGPGAENFFGVPASEALGAMRYPDFHDADEMRACQGDPAFKAAIERDGFHQAVWKVIPRGSDPFRARVWLAPLPALDNAPPDGKNEPPGWLALYQRID